MTTREMSGPRRAENGDGARSDYEDQNPPVFAQATCGAVNCRVGAHYPGVLGCDEKATHEYQLGPGRWLPVCADAARHFPASKVRAIRE